MMKFVDIEQLENNFQLTNYLFPENSQRKNAFLAVCWCLNKEVNLHDINDLAPFGGLIGPGDSLMDKWLKHFKIFRLHAIFHDAFGFMRSNFGVGPGYVYTLSEKPIFANNMFFGHITGLAFWFYQKLLHRKEYNRLKF